MKILIVEDKQEDIYLLETLLKKNGYEVVSARNGIEAIKILRDDSINMIISDILMPGMDGFQLCRECKSDDFLMNIPFVYYTATYTDKKDEEFAKGLGAEKFIIKPLAPDEFLNILKTIIDNQKKTTSVSTKPSIEDEEIYLAEYNKRLVEKLEDKVLDLENEIHKRKQAEETLLETEKMFLSIGATAQDAVVMVDDKGQVYYWNKAAERMFGYSEDEASGRYLHELVISDKFLVKFHNGFINFQNSGQGAFIGKIVELTAVRKDGTEFPIEHSIERVKTKGKWNAIGIIRDISERKELEERLKRAEKMEALGLLASGVAHDINNILTPITGYPDLMLMELPENSPLREGLISIKNSGTKAAAIVQDLLTLARRGHKDSTVINLNDIISEYIKSPEHVELTKDHTNIEFETDLAPDLLHIKCSQVHLFKVIMNLVLNAYEATSSGGKVIVSTRNQYIDMPISGYDKVDIGDYVVLLVSDNGAGISAEYLNRIFEPFYTSKQMGKSGTGLGLAVVWGTVKDCNGYIEVKSTKGEGTAFCLYFPVTRDELIKENTSVPIEELMGNGEKILIVDDVKEQREIASAILSRLGYHVTVVASGEEAIEYIRTNRVDLVILDMIMEGGLDGLDTYKEILKLQRGQKTIIASGCAETDRIRECIRLGAGEYIRKPYTLEKIGLAVKHQLVK